ncbi:glycosyl hydrolase family 61-domain-containing protein [Fusarium tricinctum]|jgi:cellulase|uniref:lytic cellulose monooxygenase (C4-dehydrogenating) n=2 Tax=Fusarium tricinctum species complex TaxID=679429 RepID=A0A8K0RTD1_9HYPO|nr:glycosyl hydrolase family 61-domain-containing protein [Fusarium tricinctum]
MRFSATAAALAMATTVSAHAQVYGLWVNGKDQGDGRSTYIRSPASNSPVKDLSSPNLVCNVNGGKAAPKFAKAAAGDEVTFEWYHDNRGDDIIDGSHKGPIITYVAPYTENDGTGAIWTKIAEDGYDGSEWAVTKLIKNKGKATFTLPSALKAGKYLVRQEIIAHHESNDAYNVNPARGAQFYPSCAQIEVTGSGTAVPDEKFDFNKGYTYSDKGIVFDIYNFSGSYSIPGPAVWKGTSSGSGSSSETKPETPAATSAAAEAPAATKPAGNDSSAEAPAPTPTFATVVRPSATAAPAETEAPSAPVTPPKTGCSSRRRRARRAARNAL